MKRVIVTPALFLLMAVAVLAWAIGGCTPHSEPAPAAPAASPATGAAAAPGDSLPPPEAGARERLDKSPRHGEWVQVPVPGFDKPMRSYIVFPERAEKAPVVIVIMEIFGLTDWIRSTTDQLAADGFIAIAPDFLSGKGPDGADVAPDQARGMIGQLTAPEILAKLNATRDYAIKLPAASGKSAVVGFCWGGTQSYVYAIHQPELNAAVVFYGSPPTTGQVPDEQQLARVRAPIAGFFGQNDQRVTATVAPTQEIMNKLAKTYEPHVFDGAGHGFMRQQTAGANLKAAQDAWPLAIKFLREHTR